LRDEPELNEEFDEAWLDHSPAKAAKPKQTAAVGQSTVTALGLSVLGVIIVAMMDQSGPKQPAAKPHDSGSNAIWRTMQGAIERIPMPKPQVRLQENFRAGLRGWQGASASASDWSFSDLGVKLGDLKIWEDSRSLTDYRLEFEGQIEKKSLGWAFRANDTRNYYASKINLSRTPGSPTAEIVRYSMLRGHESKRIALPLPIAIDANTPYHVQVKVKGDKFITAIDGQVVDVWQDARLSSGGIGFFKEKGDSASIRWVSVSDADRFLEKLRSYLYLSFIAPYAL